MNRNLPALGTEERAVYHLVETGNVTNVNAGLYRAPLRRLEAHGLIRRVDDDGYVAVYAKGEAPRRTVAPSSPPPASLPPEPARDAMVTLVVRVPPELKAELEKRGENLSETTRGALVRGLGSGTFVRSKAG